MTTNVPLRFAERHCVALHHVDMLWLLLVLMLLLELFWACVVWCLLATSAFNSNDGLNGILTT